MSYNKNIWKRKDRITKEKLNHMEDGIYEAHDKINTINNKAEENTTNTNTARQDISDIKLQIGTEELTTTSKKIKGAINDLSSQIKDKANKNEIEKNLIMHGVQRGIKDKGVTLSVMTNEPNDKSESPICGFKSSKETSLYGDRDSVGLYVGNRERNATLTINTGLTYTSDSVTIPSSYDLSCVESNMVIDTLHTQRYSALIDSVDTKSNTIYVKDGWYYNGTKGTPDNTAGVKINDTTKIWAINANIIINGQTDNCNDGVVCEYGIYNQSDTAVVGGVDVVSLGKHQLQFAYQARKSSSEFYSMKVAYLARDCKSALKNKAKDDELQQVLVESADYNGKFDISKHQKILNDGTQYKLKLVTKVYTDPSVQIEDEVGIALLVPNSENCNFSLPAVWKSYGCAKTVINCSNYTLLINAESTIYSSNQKLTTYTLLPYESVTLVSDYRNYYAISNSSKQVDIVYSSNQKKILQLDTDLPENLPKTGIQKGAMSYDRKHNKPVWWNGEKWTFADGESIDI